MPLPKQTRNCVLSIVMPCDDNNNTLQQQHRQQQQPQQQRCNTIKANEFTTWFKQKITEWRHKKISAVTVVGVILFFAAAVVTVTVAVAAVVVDVVVAIDVIIVVDAVAKYCS